MFLLLLQFTWYICCRATYKLGRSRCCHSGSHAPLNTTYLDVIFLTRMSIRHRPTNGKPALLFFVFVQAIRPIQPSARVQRLCTVTYMTKINREGQAFRLFARAARNTRFTFQIETRKIERGSAGLGLPFVLVPTCLTYRNRFSGISLDV